MSNKDFTIKRLRFEAEKMFVVTERSDGFQMQFSVNFSETHMPAVEAKLKELVEVISTEIMKGI